MNYTIYLHQLIADPSKARYVGYTSQLPEERWQGGVGYKGQLFYSAIRAYGWDAFEHRILEVGDASPEYISEREKYWCEFFKASTQYEGGFTQVAGGASGGSRKVFKVKILKEDSVDYYAFLLDAMPELTDCAFRFICGAIILQKIGVPVTASALIEQYKIVSRASYYRAIKELTDKEYLFDSDIILF